MTPEQFHQLQSAISLYQGITTRIETLQSQLSSMRSLSDHPGDQREVNFIVLQFKDGGEESYPAGTHTELSLAKAIIPAVEAKIGELNAEKAKILPDLMTHLPKENEVSYIKR